MLRPLTFFATLAVLALPVAGANAQIGFGVSAGLSQPVGNLGDAVDAGYNLTGIVNVSIPLAPVGLRFEGSYNSFNYKSSFFSGGSARIISGTANAMFGTPGIVGPYAIAGVGLYNSSASCSGCSSSSSTNAGVNGGVGIRLGLGGLAAFAEARYHYISGGSSSTTGGGSNSAQFIPITVGVTF
jgi:hypothetical protein